MVTYHMLDANSNQMYNWKHRNKKDHSLMLKSQGHIRLWEERMKEEHLINYMDHRKPGVQEAKTAWKKNECVDESVEAGKRYGNILRTQSAASKTAKIGIKRKNQYNCFISFSFKNCSLLLVILNIDCVKQQFLISSKCQVPKWFGYCLNLLYWKFVTQQ